MTEPVFRGVGVALLTFFDDGGELDAPATAEHAARLVELGVHAVVVAGTTGEAPSLSTEERSKLLASVRAAVADRTPVIAGTGASSTRQAVELTAAARDGGADGVLVLSPPGSLDVRPYYEAVSLTAGEMPVLAYHYPAVAAPGIPVERLADLPVVGCKDSSGDAERLLQTVTTWTGHLYTGAAPLLSYAGPLGCAGAIVAMANLAPELCASALSGDASAQRELAAHHFGVGPSTWAGLKRATAERFGTPTGVRMG